MGETGMGIPQLDPEGWRHRVDAHDYGDRTHCNHTIRQ